MKEFNTRVAEGDYSITFKTDDRKAYEKVQNLCRLLIDGKDSELIPIEWIKKWKWQEDNDSYNRLTIDSLIRDWEKENEANAEC